MNLDYIINPSWVYWINVLGDFKIVSIVVAIVSFFAVVIGVVVACENKGYGKDDEDYKTGKAVLRFSVPIFTLSLLFAIFIPSTRTMLEMLVAKLATKQNVELTVEGLKSCVDYIAETIKSLR